MSGNSFLSYGPVVKDVVKGPMAVRSVFKMVDSKDRIGGASIQEETGQDSSCCSIQVPYRLVELNRLECNFFILTILQEIGKCIEMFLLGHSQKWPLGHSQVGLAH